MIAGHTRLATPADAARWLRARAPSAGAALRADSRRVQPGDVFVAWPGAATDGRAHVGSALAAGAAACLVEADGAERFVLDETRVAVMPDLKALAGEVAAAWHGQPSDALAVLAVTGTNGKTSTAWWLAQALSATAQRCGVIGTLGIGQPPQVRSTGLTTPDPVTLQAAFADFRGQGYAACAIEASSIGIAEHRLAGTRVRVALFTNFTRDHLDYHGDMARYWAAKRRLFGWPGLEAAVINVDDPAGAGLAAELALEAGLDCWTVSADGPARLRAEGVHYREGGLAFDVVEGEARASLRSTLIGDYNVHNLLGVIGGLRALGISLDAAVATVPGLTPVPGRMQRVPGPAGRAAPDVVVDYAHTPDALDKVLLSLRPLARSRGGRLWCVFGCGGDRDASKRPLMGAAAARGADELVITSDNPRGEDPRVILAQVGQGVPEGRARAEVDRRRAIVQAVHAATPADVVLIAGKGHEDYQEIAGQRLPFSDVQEAGQALGSRTA